MALPMSILTVSDRHSSDPSNLAPHMGGRPSSTQLNRSPEKLPISDVTTRSRSTLATAPVRYPLRSVNDGALNSEGQDDDATSGSDSDGDKPYYSDEKIYVETSRVPSHFPTHPLIEMQGPFEESMLDAGKNEDSSNYRETNPDKFKGRSRRSLILNQKGGAGNVSYNAQWTSDSDAKHHPIMKIMSQVIFGVHLLCQSMAQSVPEVSNILSGFVQELDSFLERVNGDFDQSLKEVSDLYRNLALPLQHVSVFDNLLTDRKYRTQTLEGNIRIDALIKAYSQMMNDYTADLAKLQEANLVFSTYLKRIGAEWTRDSKEQWDIYVAMSRNTEIWENNVKILQDKARKLGKMLQRCALCVNEFEKRCAAAARRTMQSQKQQSQKQQSRASSRSSTSRSSSGRKEKPLPALPSKAEIAVSSPSTPLRQVMNADSTPARAASNARVRPKPYKNTGLGKLQPRDKQRAESTAELAAFFRSVPPPHDYDEAPPSQELVGRQFDGPSRFVKHKKSKAASLGGATYVSATGSRPSTAPVGAPKHIPLWTLMEQSPNTISSDGSTAKSFLRHDSAAPSGRQSRQSQKSNRHATSHGRIRFMFRNPFKR